ncbi:MAG: glutamine synthetase type III, partial [bacterium]|nr:glutamine synthetase type III [bacterium]
MPYEFATHVFGLEELQKSFSPHILKEFMKTLDEKKTLAPDVAESIAWEIKRWAEAKGVTHYTHWFLPLTGLTAGKQNTFLDRGKDGKIISKFSGKELIKGEPDASSFPHGGMRSTFEARGYTAWDPTSPVFINESEKGCILYIPSVFFGYNGKVLDKKTPLLRSLKLINDVSLKILKKFDKDVMWVKNMIGPEQEFFLVDEKDYLKRPDLRTLGRIIFAANPPKGQQMGDHYFGAIPEKVLSYLEDVEEQSLKLGIPIITRHNEVAPNQFEVAPLYEEANTAADHNQMLMDLLLDTARRHGMVCLLHEKPFNHFNGSGKHINWSVSDSKNRNLLSPGKTKGTRLSFLCFMTGFIVGLNRHNDLIQSILASPGNEFRLGGHEAPPAITSTFLGAEIQDILKNLHDFKEGKIKEAPLIKVDESVPAILHDMSDRNRTSPVAFTGNKFEFRMPGSSASISFPIAVMNLAVADGLEEVYHQIVSVDDDKLLLEILDKLIQENSNIIFEGDNYGQEWLDEAKKRGLFIPDSVPDAIDQLKNEKNIALFEKFKLLDRDEIEARSDIKIEIYVKTVEMELKVARYMLRAYIIPAAMKNQQILLAATEGFPQAILKEDPSVLDKQHGFIKRFTQKINKAMDMIALLD